MRDFKVSLLLYTYNQEVPRHSPFGTLSLCPYLQPFCPSSSFPTFIPHSLMSSTSSSSSSSSQSSSTTSTPYDAAAAANVGAHNDIPGPSTRRTGRESSEGPSSSRQRAMNEVWPEPVVELLATQVATDSAHYHGRLAAASSLAIVFQVTSLSSPSSSCCIPCYLVSFSIFVFFFFIFVKVRSVVKYLIIGS